jgi:hypothetical protein
VIGVTTTKAIIRAYGNLARDIQAGAFEFAGAGVWQPSVDRTRLGPPLDADGDARPYRFQIKEQELAAASLVPKRDRRMDLRRVKCRHAARSESDSGEGCLCGSLASTSKNLTWSPASPTD